MIPIFLQHPNKLFRLSDSSEFAELSKRWGDILHTLMEVEGISIQIYSQMSGRGSSNAPSQCRRQKDPTSHFVTSAIVYGPPELFASVGEFTSQCKIYLRDPLLCDRNVQYWNPHLLLSPDEEPVMTGSLES